MSLFFDFYLIPFLLIIFSHFTRTGCTGSRPMCVHVSRFVFLCSEVYLFLWNVTCYVFACCTFVLLFHDFFLLFFFHISLRSIFIVCLYSSHPEHICTISHFGQDDKLCVLGKKNEKRKMISIAHKHNKIKQRTGWCNHKQLIVAEGCWILQLFLSCHLPVVHDFKF